MSIRVKVTSHTRGLRELREAIDRNADRIVRKTAFDLQGEAMQRAPVDTGFLKNSIYVRTESSSGYAGATENASEQSADGRMLPEVARPREHTAIVAVGAEYGVHVELGTARRAATPFLAPAAERVRPQFEKALKGILGE